VTRKNAIFWDTNNLFVPRRKHITSLLHSPAGKCYVRFEVFLAVTMKNAIFWDVTYCGVTSLKTAYFSSIYIMIVRYSITGH
jgi:hypothetical protein